MAETQQKCQNTYMLPGIFTQITGDFFNYLITRYLKKYYTIIFVLLPAIFGTLDYYYANSIKDDRMATVCKSCNLFIIQYYRTTKNAYHTP